METNFVTRARDLYDVTARDLARHAALSGLAALDDLTGRSSAALARPRVQILSLHHIFDDEVEPFRRLLASLQRRHTFIPYSDAVRKIREGNPDRPYIAVTFDDGLATSLRAAQVLEEFGATGCFFVCPSIVGERDPAVMARFCAERLRMRPMTFLDWSQVESLRARGHEIGSHTMSHANLAEVTPAQLESEVGGSFEELRRRLGPVEHFAWPFGRFFHISARAAKAVFDAGFATCASGERGCHVAPESEPRALCIRRDHTIARWPASHVRHFLVGNSRNAGPEQNHWPATLDPRVAKEE